MGVRAAGRPGPVARRRFPLPPPPPPPPVSLALLLLLLPSALGWAPPPSSSSSFSLPLPAAARAALRASAADGGNESGVGVGGGGGGPSVDAEKAPSKIEVVLFGVGDLRASDHPGLTAAVRSGRPVLPLVVLDGRDALPNLPQARTQTWNAASILSSSIRSLGDRLSEVGGGGGGGGDGGLRLNVKFAEEGEGLKDALLEVLAETTRPEGAGNGAGAVAGAAAAGPPAEEVIVHVCDLGDADNAIGYGPYAHLKGERLDLPDGTAVALRPWTCRLREGPWADLDSDAWSLPDRHPAYEARYDLKAGAAAAAPLPLPTPPDGGGGLVGLTVPSCLSLPDDDDGDGDGARSALSKRVFSLLCDALDVDPSDPATKKRLENERDTGLYGTHWGGLDGGLVDEAEALSGLDAFASLNEQDSKLLVSDWWKSRRLVRNGRSLEHASIEWMMSEFSDYRDVYGGHHQFAEVDAGNLIRGEFMTRYLAAPLLYGVVGARQLWHAADVEDPPLAGVLPFLRREGALRSLAEGREWHNLLAARNIRTGAATATAEGGVGAGAAFASAKKKKDGEMSYGYWRWHGFLCRYGTASLRRGDTAAAEEEGKGKGKGVVLVLVHGFGASGAQWSKAVEELSRRSTGAAATATATTTAATATTAAAPDLIGFGQSEKPPLTYTQYLWESYASSFVREVCLPPPRLGMDAFVAGGNSIGGYTAMGLAADDAVPVDGFAHDLGDDGRDRRRSFVSASGAPGTGRCRGLVLMNSAGRLYRREEVDGMLRAGAVATVAAVTASDRLPKCAPPPRGVASAFGSGLLAYLRPRIPSICVNLYPTNPAAVDDVLTGNILRDSLDPGAINVMISGSKLPPPRTANELLGADFGSSRSLPDDSVGAAAGTGTGTGTGATPVAEGSFDGPVLVAQGVLDPLNDARGRADTLESLRAGVEVARIEAGHCPHDEVPGEVAEAVAGWMARNFAPPAAAGGSAGGGGGERGTTAAAAAASA